MSKNKKTALEAADVSQQDAVNQKDILEEIADIQAEEEKEAQNKKDSKPAKADDKKSKAKKKEKKPSRLARRLKETGSELKKVTWPKFGTVVKQTGVVIAIVVIFTVVLFGIDQLLGLMFRGLVG